MSGNGDFTPASTPAVAEHFSSWLFGKSSFAALGIMAEELTYFQANDYTMAKDGKVVDVSYISAVYLFAHAATIRAYSFI